MNWLIKLNSLPSDWWKNPFYHLSNVAKNEFQRYPIPFIYSNSVNNSDSEPQLIYGDSRNSTFKSTFGQYDYFFSFILTAKNHKYWCSCCLQFDRYIADKLDYLKHDVIGMDKIDAKLVGSKCSIIRDAGSGQGRSIGPVELYPQETTPYEIMKTIRSMIDADNDDDGETEYSEPDPYPEISSPAPVNNPVFVGNI